MRYNARHRRCGHLTQGRYGARLVAGDEYLFKLSRYVHLNPVQVKGNKTSRGRTFESVEGIADLMLEKYAGLTRRACAPLLGLRSGMAVNYQIRRTLARLKTDAGLARQVAQLDARFEKKAKS